ncbi:MAG: M14 family zinc carboxypeptidase, partial [Candidatus Hodarchaeales archaeon]
MKFFPRLIMILLFIFLLSNIAQGNAVQNTPVFSATVRTNNSVNRIWEDISLIYPDQYHTPEQVVEELNLITATAPHIVEMSVLGQSIQGRDIHLMKITNEQNTVPKAGVFIIAQHHAREQISVEVALRFMHH